MLANARLDDAIERSADAVARLQRPDGSWRGRNDGGPMYVAASVALLAALGCIDERDRARAERTLRRAPLADGGLAAWPGASVSNAEATTYFLAGLRAVGVDARDPIITAADRRLAELGGTASAGPIAPTVAVMVGALPIEVLPRVPAWLALVPGHDPIVSRLLGVNSLLPLRTLPWLWHALRSGVFPLGERTPSWSNPLDRRTAATVEHYLRGRQAPSGGLAGVPIFTWLGLLCLRACGVPPHDDAIVRGLAYTRRVVHGAGDDFLAIEPFESTYWDTAHMVRVLARSSRHLEAARRGAQYLARGQSRTPSPPDWQQRPRGAPSCGGWSWQPGNEHNPDFDTTAEVLSALGTLADVSAEDRAAFGPSIRRGLTWLLAFQNEDGGWAAFSYGKPRPPAGPLYVRRSHPIERVRSWLAERGDPSTADIVGRVLYGLGAASVDSDHPAVERAVEFLAVHRGHGQLASSGAPVGPWWGRWAINYIAATAYILSGLARVGAQPRWMNAALLWLESRQNLDGGWGETPSSYDDPRDAGRGPSTVCLTGLVTWALQVAGRRASPAVARGLAFLLRQRCDDGTFVDPAPFGTIFPRRSYWRNDTYPTYFALEALLEARHG